MAQFRKIKPGQQLYLRLFGRSIAMAPTELRTYAVHCLVEPDPGRKVAALAVMHNAWMHGACALETASALTPSAEVPGRPERPQPVAPRLVGRRSVATREGRAMLVHALAHIEFNAMNLALDALWRFPGLPPEYYADWLRVAMEESTHFSLLAEHLALLGHAYGDFPAHDSLWEMVGKTCGDVLGQIGLSLAAESAVRIGLSSSSGSIAACLTTSVPDSHENPARSPAVRLDPVVVARRPRR